MLSRSGYQSSFPMTNPKSKSAAKTKAAGAAGLAKAELQMIPLKKISPRGRAWPWRRMQPSGSTLNPTRPWTEWSRSTPSRETAKPWSPRSTVTGKLRRDAG